MRELFSCLIWTTNFKDVIANTKVAILAHGNVFRAKISDKKRLASASAIAGPESRR